MKSKKAIFPTLSKEIRKNAHMNQPDLIKKLNLSISTNTLGNYENGYSDTPASILVKMADFYGCSVDALLLRSHLKPLKIKANFARSDYAIENGIGTLRHYFMPDIYAFDKGLDPDKNTYRYVVLLQDDPNIHLEKNTRLIVKMVDGTIFDINRGHEQIYMITETIKDESRKKVATTIFTKANMVRDHDGYLSPSNLIYYTYQNQIKFAGFNQFKSMIEGIVVKTFLDTLTETEW